MRIFPKSRNAVAVAGQDTVVALQACLRSFLCCVYIEFVSDDLRLCQFGFVDFAMRIVLRP